MRDQRWSGLVAAGDLWASGLPAILGRAAAGRRSMRTTPTPSRENLDAGMPRPTRAPTPPDQTPGRSLRAARVVIVVTCVCCRAVRPGEPPPAAVQAACKRAQHGSSRGVGRARSLCQQRPR
jgi:hypothetical protein